MPKELPPPPKSDKRDKLHQAGKVTLGVAGTAATLVTGVPGLSILAQEFFNTIVKPPLIKRTGEYLTQLYEKLLEIEKKVDGFKIESLSENEFFISMISNATQKTLHSHQKEKLEALQNVVLHAAVGTDIDQNLQTVFLRFIDELTPIHLKMLMLFEEPTAYMQKVNRVLPKNNTFNALEGMIEHAIPELRKEHELTRVYFNDLYTYGLINTKSDMLGVTMSHTGVLCCRTTDVARLFLKAISQPDQLRAKD